MRSKAAILKTILQPHGFIKKASCFFRFYREESVQVIGLERQRSLKTVVCAGLISVYHERLPAYLEEPPLLYTMGNFVGMRTGQRWDRETDERLRPIYARRDCFVFEPTDEEDTRCLEKIVIPMLDECETQSDLLRLFHRLDLAEFDRDQGVTTKRVYPALAVGAYDLARDDINAIEEQHRFAFEANRKRWDPEACARYMEQEQASMQSLYAIRERIGQEDHEAIAQQLTELRERNTSLICSFLGKSS